MRFCRQWFRGTLLVGILLIGTLIIALIIPVLNRVFSRHGRPLRQAMVSWWNRTVCRILNLEIITTGQIDPSAGLTVANHVSWLDIIAIGAQHPFLFVAKEEVADWPILGYLARGIGTLFIRRGDADQSAAMSEMMTWRLRRGERLMLFPEGTTTDGKQVLRFHGKLFQPAQRAGASVQAIALKYSGEAAAVAPFIGDDDLVPHMIKLLGLPKIRLHLHYCPSLPSGLRRDQLGKATRLQITERLFPVPASEPIALNARAITKL